MSSAQTAELAEWRVLAVCVCVCACVSPVCVCPLCVCVNPVCVCPVCVSAPCCVSPSWCCLQPHRPRSGVHSHRRPSRQVLVDCLVLVPEAPQKAPRGTGTQREGVLTLWPFSPGSPASPSKPRSPCGRAENCVTRHPPTAPRHPGGRSVPQQWPSRSPGYRPSTFADIEIVGAPGGSRTVCVCQGRAPACPLPTPRPCPQHSCPSWLRGVTNAKPWWAIWGRH